MRKSDSDNHAAERVGSLRNAPLPRCDSPHKRPRDQRSTHHGLRPSRPYRHCHHGNRHSVAVRVSWQGMLNQQGPFSTPPTEAQIRLTLRPSLRASPVVLVREASGHHRRDGTPGNYRETRQDQSLRRDDRYHYHHIHLPSALPSAAPGSIRSSLELGSAAPHHPSHYPVYCRSPTAAIAISVPATHKLIHQRLIREDRMMGADVGRMSDS